jgi:carbon-monoxide dehydrogenase small subunit
MTRLSLTINGTEREIDVEPRLSLADFLRDREHLTATHIGCEHGVCGACTVLVDGAPTRSCILFAVACEGADITTLEGLEEDPVVEALRSAFQEHHGLQCGYCTPGMLISARDILTRLPDAGEDRMRLELSGNLCRCTGYVGIVAAIRSVQEKHRDSPLISVPLRDGLGPHGSHPPAKKDREASGMGARGPITRQVPQRAALTEIDLSGEDWAAVEAAGVELQQSFDVGYPRNTVWKFFEDLGRVAQCMPGARLTAQPQDHRAEGELTVKLGPITSAFSGVLEIKRDDKQYTGVVHGAGRDSKSATRARAIITYQVSAEADDVSRVSVSVKFLLAGTLAQFSRSGLVKNVADHLTKTFARNLEAQLSGIPAADSATSLSALSVMRAVIWGWITAPFRILFGK